MRSRDLNPSLPQPRYVLCLLYATQDRLVEFNSELQGLRAVDAANGAAGADAGAGVTRQAIQMRANNYPFPWQQVMQALFGGGQSPQPQMPYPQQPPQAFGGWTHPGYATPGGPSEFDQAGDVLKAWWQKLTS